MTRHADHAIDPAFTARWSPRAFDARAITQDDLNRVLEAARWAPSAMNHQPWRAAYGLRGTPAFDAIAAGLAPFNHVWAVKSAALIAWASRGFSLRDGAAQPNPWAAFDAGTAWGYLALQAQNQGLAAHAMGGFDSAALAEKLSLSEGYTIHAVIALGYQGAKDSLPEALAARESPNDRAPITTWASEGRFL